jgi:alpha-ketoglutarate-dependent taurine dioxygenase
MTLSYQPVMEQFGVEVEGVDLASDFSDDVLHEIIDALYTHSVLLFRGQDLKPADHTRLLHRFGRPKIETRKQYNLRDNPEVSVLGNIVDEDGKPLAFFNRGGEAWHTDGTAACHTNAATFLFAVEVPKQGGDTMFCSTAYAYETLPEELKQKLDGVKMLCSFHAHNDRIIARDPASHEALTPEERAALPDVWHDIVQTHPVTGRKSLYMNRQPLEIEGLEAGEGEDTLRHLHEHATQAHLVYRHRWTPGDMIIWDNLSTFHSATDVGLYEKDRRLMFRSLVYMMPTTHPLENLDEINAIFLGPEGKGALVLP